MGTYFVVFNHKFGETTQAYNKAEARNNFKSWAEANGYKITRVIKL